MRGKWYHSRVDLGGLLTGDALISLVTLTAMEIVLGIDNVVFIAILVGRLPAGQQTLGRRLGLILALGIRIGLLLTISWIMGLTEPLFTVFGGTLSGRDLILIGGGLFLIAKATWEIYDKLEADHPAETPETGSRGAFLWVLFQILVLDIVFSLDSVITAVGMANHIPVMVVAMVLAMLVMLVAEGMGTHVNKGYIYVAMTFSLFVELLNFRYRKKRKPVTLHRRFESNVE